MTQIYIVRAAPGCTVPLPRMVVASPTGAQAALLSAPPAGRAPYPHELTGELRLELADPIAISYVRRRINAGDLVEVKPPAPAVTLK